MRLADALVRWLERHLPGAASPDAIEAREQHTEDVRQDAITARKGAEKLAGYRRINLGRR